MSTLSTFCCLHFYLSNVLNAGRFHSVVLVLFTSVKYLNTSPAARGSCSPLVHPFSLFQSTQFWIEIICQTTLEKTRKSLEWHGSGGKIAPPDSACHEPAARLSSWFLLAYTWRFDLSSAFLLLIFTPLPSMIVISVYFWICSGKRRITAEHRQRSSLSKCKSDDWWGI